MWSGPRNLSTALLRSFGNRPDTFVSDEPLYAHYLKQTGVAHPGADEVMAVHECDWRKVVEWITGPVPQERAIWYQKHMTHHLLPEIGREWLSELRHAFLLRDPREVLPSLDAKYARPKLADTGLPQQLEIFELVRRSTGRVPPVIDARDLANHPHTMLAALCRGLDIPFDASMLRWPRGRRETDGVWAKHWYEQVERSTGFERFPPRTAPLAEHLEPIYAQCRPYYEELAAHKLHA